MTTIVTNDLDRRSRRLVVDRLQESVSESGAILMRQTSRVRYWDFQLVWVVDRAGLDQIMSHWAATGEAEFTYDWPWDGESYSVKYTAAPRSQIRAHSMWRVEARLRGYKL